MNRALIITSLFLLILTVSGCKPLFEIGGNSYRYLNKSALNSLNAMTDTVYSNKGREKRIYEISQKNITDIIKSNLNGVFVFFLPYSPVEQIGLIKEVYDLCKSSENVNLYLVSRTYDMYDLNSLNEKIGNNSAVFILKDHYFGHNIRKGNIKLNELFAKFNSLQKMENMESFYDCIIVQDGSLVLAKDNIDSEVLEYIAKMSD